MKRKYIIPIFFILIFSLSAKNNLKSVKGYIHSYGNMPFNYPAIQVSKNKVLLITDYSKYSKNELLNLQGHFLKITGEIAKKKIDKNVYEHYIKIEEIQIIK